MKVIKINTDNSFSCIPRVYPKIGDSLKLELINELTKEVLNISFTYSVLNTYLTIVINTVPKQLENGAKYAISITNMSQNNVVTYNGKLMVVDENTDIQNYEYTKQSESIFKYE